MTAIEQLKEAFVYSPLTLARFRRNSARWMAVYFAAGLAVFALVSWYLLDNQQIIKQALLDYLFPQSWHSVSEQLAEFMFESQAKTVIANMILGASLVMASICLFPIKEKYSAEFEKDAGFDNGPVEEFSLTQQAIEETKLFLFYLTAQLVILWIGYYPYAWADWLSVSLSYLFLFFTFGVDFISPTLQRHRLAYSLILKVMFKRPFLATAFGAIFSLPIVLIARYVLSLPELTLIDVIALLFLTNIIFLTLAVPVGTRIASSMLPEIRQTKPPQQKSKRRWYALMFMTLAVMLFLHGRLISSIHHKTQILKANYSIDWSSIDYQLPSLNQFLGGEAKTEISFDLAIENPTEFDIIIENSQLIVEKAEQTIATIDLDGFDIPSEQLRTVRIKLDTVTDVSLITNYQEIMQGWRIDLHLQVWPGIPFIINVMRSQ